MKLIRKLLGIGRGPTAKQQDKEADDAVEREKELLKRVTAANSDMQIVLKELIDLAQRRIERENGR